MAKKTLAHRSSRREFVKKAAKAAYVVPVILSLQAAPSFAKKGSKKDDDPKPKPVSGS